MGNPKEEDWSNNRKPFKIGCCFFLLQKHKYQLRDNSSEKAGEYLLLGIKNNSYNVGSV